MVLDIISIGPELKTIQPSETLQFDVVSSCPMGEQDTDGDYDVFMEHVKATGVKILPVPIRMGSNCRIPFPSERIDTRPDFADYTPMQYYAEFAALATTAGLIRGEDKLVIRGLCNSYRDLSKVRVFVTNVGDTVEDLAYLHGCIFRLMAWKQIHSQGFPYTRPLLYVSLLPAVINLFYHSPPAICRRKTGTTLLLVQLLYILLIHTAGTRHSAVVRWPLPID
jgi:hypothetical protein